MLLSERHSCPVCGAGRELAEPNTSAFDFNQGRDYLAPLLDTEGPDFRSHIAAMRSYKCKVCRAYFLDPWLSSNGRLRVFVTGHPIHNVGWRSFLERVERNLTPDLQVDPSRLLETLNSRVGGLVNYFEFGCPFQGLLLHMSKRIELEEYRAFSNVISGMSPKHSRRFLIPSRIFLRGSGLAKNLAFTISRVRTYRDKLRRRFKTEPTLSLRDLPALQKYFVPLESSKFWGVNCSMFGESCAATAVNSLGATVISRSEFKSLGRIENSCIGLFNVLDHQDDPMQLLRECLQQATAVIVLGHEPPLGIQHHFGLGSDFFESLPILIEGVEVKRLSTEGAPTLLYLVSLRQ